MVGDCLLAGLKIVLTLWLNADEAFATTLGAVPSPNFPMGNPPRK